MPTSSPAPSSLPRPGAQGAEQSPHLYLESRPSRLFAARYDRLPFPNVSPMQEVAFDIGLTAFHAAITLTGLVFRGYSGHQLLFEQRWPARIIRLRTGEQDLTIPPQTGLAVRSLQFLLHGYEPLTMVEVTAVGKLVDGDQTVQALLQLPVEFPDQQTDLHFPLAGVWWAIQAADWSDQHKQEVFSQTYALDFVKLGADNRFFAGSGMTLEEHYSWSQPVYATAGGKVAYVGYDMPDMPPGVPPDPRIYRDDPRRFLGNAVAISHANGEFSYYGHLQQASLEVNEGQVVRRGTLLGRVGNSGHSPGPHLHFHLMNGPNLFIDQGLPVKFSHFWAGGQFFTQLTHIPTRLIVIGPERTTAETPAQG
jgi:hypothetical protein